MIEITIEQTKQIADLLESYRESIEFEYSHAELSWVEPEKDACKQLEDILKERVKTADAGNDKRG